MVWFHLLIITNVFIPLISPGSLEPHKTNIILVGGFTSKPNTFLTGIRKELLARDYNVLTPDLGWEVHDINLHTEKLHEFLTRSEVYLYFDHHCTIKDLIARKKIILIGHSMGGLIVANLGKQYPEFNKIPIIPLASPLQGTPLAYLESWISTAAEEMKPNSKWIQALQKDLKENPRVLVQIRAYRGLDELVPGKYSCLPEYLREDSNHVGHLSLIYTPPMEILEKYLPPPQ